VVRANGKLSTITHDSPLTTHHAPFTRFSPANSATARAHRAWLGRSQSWWEDPYSPRASATHSCFQNRCCNRKRHERHGSPPARWSNSWPKAKRANVAWFGPFPSMPEDQSLKMGKIGRLDSNHPYHRPPQGRAFSHFRQRRKEPDFPHAWESYNNREVASSRVRQNAGLAARSPAFWRM